MPTKNSAFKFSKPVSYLKFQQLSSEIYNFGLYLIVRDLQMLGLSTALPQTDNFQIKLRFTNHEFNQHVLKRLEKYVQDNESDLSKVKEERLVRAVITHPENFTRSMITPLQENQKNVDIHLKTLEDIQILTISSRPLPPAPVEPKENA